jgi:hypothetical protein
MANSKSTTATIIPFPSQRMAATCRLATCAYCEHPLSRLEKPTSQRARLTATLSAPPSD